MIQMQTIGKMLAGSISIPIVYTIMAPEPEFWIEDKKKLVMVNPAWFNIFFSKLHIETDAPFTHNVRPGHIKIPGHITLFAQQKRTVAYFNTDDDKKINSTRVRGTYSNWVGEKEKMFTVKNRD
jgi:hypothetical protein